MRWLLLALALVAVGCDEPVKCVTVRAKIVSVVPEDTNWGCVGADYRTGMKDEYDRVFAWCGNWWGEPGDEFIVYFVTGRYEDAKNGHYRLPPSGCDCPDFPATTLNLGEGDP